MSRITPDDEQNAWLRSADTAFRAAAGSDFTNADLNRDALSYAWDAIEVLVDRDTFWKLVNG